MLECFGAAVHDEVLKATKAEFDLKREKLNFSSVTCG